MAREAARGEAGLPQLAQRALRPGQGARVKRLAVRAIARVGGAEAVTWLRGFARSEDPVLRGAAIEGLGIAGSEADAAAVAAAWDDPALQAGRERILWALGRIGTPREEGIFVSALLSGDSALVAAAGRALGVWGRRGLPLSPRVRDALAQALAHPEPDARFGLAYALATAAEPGKADIDLLASLLGEEAPEVRALAVRGLARRGELGPVEAGLADPDWRVQVEAVRGLSSAEAGEAGRRRLVQWLGAWTGRLEAPRAHAPLEALRRLWPHTDEEAVGAAFTALAERKIEGEPLALGEWACLLAAGRTRQSARAAPLLGCPRGPWPLAAWAKLVAALVEKGSEAFDVAAVEPLLAHAEPGVRAPLLAAALHAPDPKVRALGLERAAAALADDVPIVAAAVADALAEEARSAHPSEPGPGPKVEAALVARALREVDSDPALGISFVDAVGALSIEAGKEVCLRAARHANRSVREHGLTCLAELGVGVHFVGARQAPKPPPVDLASVLRGPLRLVFETTKGRLVVALEAEEAPWAAASMASLAGAGFYDGTVIHRVVPNFVVQGGDPTGSGYGGPGYVLPAEPGGTFPRGAVGIADAGWETGGSQFFVMHAEAPHLSGRYTRVGRVVEGLEVVDRLLVGDRILSVRRAGVAAGAGVPRARSDGASAPGPHRAANHSPMPASEEPRRHAP